MYLFYSPDILADAFWTEVQRKIENFHNTSLSLKSIPKKNFESQLET